MKLVKIFGRMQRWIDQGNHGITVGSLMHKFPVNSVGARWILDKFYEKYGTELDIRRGYYVIRHPPQELVQDVPEREDVEVSPSKSEVHDSGIFVTEAELEEMKKSDEVFKVYLYSVHPSALDDSERFMDIEFDAITRTKKKKSRNPLATLHPKSEDRSRPIKTEADTKKQREVEVKKAKEAEAKKAKEAARIDALFAAAGTREKIVSPKGKKVTTPVKPAEDFFKPSPKKKGSETSEEASPPKKTVYKNLTMDDVFTTGEDEPDLIIDESVSHKSKSPESRYRPKKMSAKAASKTVYGEPSVVPMDVDEAEAEIEDEPGSSSSPVKVKRMQNVTDTYMADDGDDEGAFIVTEVSKKMVETDETAPPPAKKTKAKTAPPAKEQPKSKKGQSSLLNFFKKP